MINTKRGAQDISIYICKRGDQARPRQVVSFAYSLVVVISLVRVVSFAYSFVGVVNFAYSLVKVVSFAYYLVRVVSFVGLKISLSVAPHFVVVT